MKNIFVKLLSLMLVCVFLLGFAACTTPQSPIEGSESSSQKDMGYSYSFHSFAYNYRCSYSIRIYSRNKIPPRKKIIGNG